MGGFNKKISNTKIEAMKDSILWKKWLKESIMSGKIFPAIRHEEIHFYYKGGCLLKYSGDSFKFNKAYLKHNCLWKSIGYNSEDEVRSLKGYVSLSSIFPEKKNESEILNYRDNLQDAVEKKFTYEGNGNAEENHKAERNFLEPLYKFTYANNYYNNSIVVLDIEVRNNEIINEKLDKSKCDLVLFNKEKGMIMFVEAKLARDSRVRSSCNKYEVINQINKYNEGIENCKVKYCEQYENYISLMENVLKENVFGENIIQIGLCKTAKLIIFEGEKNGNFQNHICSLKKQLEKDVVYFNFEESENITPEKIWNAFD